MIYNYNNYELFIRYNSMSEQYEGYCRELDISLCSKSKEWLESCFRERVDNI